MPLPVNEALPVAAEAAAALFILAGSFFLLAGSLGLAVLPDMMRRLHAPTLATTLGLGGMLAASMIVFTAVEGTLSLREPMVAFFLLLTAPVTAQMLAKAHLLRHPELRETLAPTGGDAPWATQPTAGGDPGEA